MVKLQGSLSGGDHDCDQLTGVDSADGKPLLVRYDLPAAGRTLSPASLTARTGAGLWRWRELLPVRDRANVVFLGEGESPLLGLSRLGRHLGLERLAFKVEGLNPTGSFKARGMAVAVSRAVELGARHLVAPSAGNAAGALAAYASAAGVPATVVMPADAPDVNKVEAILTGANLVLLDGLISDCGRLAREIADGVGGFDLSTLKEPYRLEGKKTMGFELAEQRGWRLPDVIVYPTGGGTGLIGIWKAFAELEEMGWIGPARPRIVSVQSDHCAPIVRAFHAGDRFATSWPEADTVAAGLRVPSALGDFMILDCIRASGGTAIAVPEAEIAAMQHTIGRHAGGYVSLETAAAMVGAESLLRRGLVDRNDDIVVIDTASGYKSARPSAALPAPLSADGAGWESAIDALRRALTPAPA